MLFRMLEDTSYANVVSWTPRGDAFVVKDMNEFSLTILPRTFKHSNFASFVRQLNKYDFHKIKNSDDDPFGEHVRVRAFLEQTFMFSTSFGAILLIHMFFFLPFCRVGHSDTHISARTERNHWKRSNVKVPSHANPPLHQDTECLIPPHPTPSPQSKPSKRRLRTWREPKKRWPCTFVTSRRITGTC